MDGWGWRLKRRGYKKLTRNWQVTKYLFKKPSLTYWLLYPNHCLAACWDRRRGWSAITEVDIKEGTHRGNTTTFRGQLVMFMRCVSSECVIFLCCSTFCSHCCWMVVKLYRNSQQQLCTTVKRRWTLPGLAISLRHCVCLPNKSSQCGVCLEKWFSFRFIIISTSPFSCSVVPCTWKFLIGDFVKFHFGTRRLGTELSKFDRRRREKCNKLALSNHCSHSVNIWLRWRR